MKKRVYSAAVLIAILATAVALDRASGTAWFSAALIAVVLSMGAVECHTLLRLRGRRRAGGTARGAWKADAGRALMAVGCVGLPGAFLLAVRMQEGGLLAALYLVAVVKMADNGALFVGRLWGRHKLAPVISPAKTVEGACGGLVAAAATAVALGRPCTGDDIGAALAFGLVIGPLAVVGDLAESRLKREAGVKDSGALMPGIGGVLDLMDSVLLSAPAAYFLLTLLTR